jgi:hypothetical protein
MPLRKHIQVSVINKTPKKKSKKNIEEAEVDYREELICVIEVIRREKKKNKKLQVELDK